MSEQQFYKEVMMERHQAEVEFETLYDKDELNGEYAEYIIENSAGDRLICNGDMLISAMEDGYLYDSFKDSWVDSRVGVQA